MKYLLDTNAVIYLLRGSNIDNVPFNNDDEILISFVTKIELLSYTRLSNNEEQNIQFFFDESKIIMINDAIIDKTIAFKKESGLKLPDSIIIATAFNNNAVLITSDKQLLKKSDKLNVKTYDLLKV